MAEVVLCNRLIPAIDIPGQCGLETDQLHGLKIMDIEDTLFAFAFSDIFVTAILFVLFGQVTVRKLRKKPETKDHLGISLASGWDMINVANAFCEPKWYRERVKKSPMAAFSADYDLLYKHTTLFDRILARTFMCLWVSSGICLILFALLDSFRVFD